MKKSVFITLFVIFTLVLSLFIYLYSEQKVKAESEKKVYQKMLQELQKEKVLIEEIKQNLDIRERNLAEYATQLDRKLAEQQRKMEELERKEKDLNDKIEKLTLDRQTIETYENIEAEQAAILISNLYKKDSNLATMVMRKISGKNAGEILDAMIQLDRETSTLLAKEVLDYFKPDDQ